jgi:GTP-binding protein HflX
MSESCIIIHPNFKSRLPGRPEREYTRLLESELSEAEGLAEAIELEVLDVHVANIAKISPGHLLGLGAREEIGIKIKQFEPSVVIVNFNLTPAQQRNLEKEWNVKVIDRTGLILEIFGARASTKEGRIQVELAFLSYQRSRLVKSWSHLERQRGSTGKTGGPGETQLEIDRRLTDEKISRLEKQLEQVRKQRGLQREGRERTPFPIVAIVGYTNAGKSTMFNKLTGAQVFAEDLHFATLDPTLRRLRLPSDQIVILSDTVGFISELPTTLVAAFRATLEQVQYADVILHVRDISSDDTDAQREDVIKVMGELGIDYKADKRVLEVLNKVDLLEAEGREIHRDAEFRGRQIAVSAKTGQGLEELLVAVGTVLNQSRTVITLTLPASQGKAIAWLHSHVAIVERSHEDENVIMKVKMDQSEQDKFRHQFPALKDAISS